MNDRPPLKMTPHSKESEMMVLGCMLTSINSLNISADALDDSDFYFTEHKIIFQSLKRAYKQEKPADVHLIAEDLKRENKLDAAGGIAYLTTLAQFAGTSAYIDEYNDLVKNKAILRKMILAAQDVEKKALEDPADVRQALDEAQAKFFQISQATNAFNGKLLHDILGGVKSETGVPFLKELQERQERFQELGPEEIGITGLSTCFTDVDKMLNGLNNSNLMILAARPAMGKTALAMNIAENVCFKTHLPVGIFSLEMSAEQLCHRIVCSQAEVESDKIKTGALDGLEYQRIVGAVHQMQQHMMIIDDQPGLKITDLRARARRMKETYGIAFLVVDYLQLLSGSGSSRNSENRQSEIAEISRMLKNLARELNIPILCLSQLSRKVEDRPGHRPMMSDLRESGCLTGDTEIKDAHSGKIYTIKELADRKEQTPLWVNGVDKALKVAPRKMVKAFYSGKKKVYQLTTKTGRNIKASGNHPFLKLEGWTPLEKLQPGMHIALPRGYQDLKNKSLLNNHELKLLAHLLGDGCILPRQPYHYTSEDMENISEVSDSAKSLFGIEGRIVPQSNWFHIYLPSPYRLTKGRNHPITNWYDKLGIKRVRSYEKLIPEDVFGCPNKSTAFFLKHLWSTDGNISLKKIKGRKTSGAIYYASSSPKLSYQVQHLLLQQGIQSTLRAKPSKKGFRHMYHVYVQSTPSQKTFLQKIGAIGKRGQVGTALLVQLNDINANPNNDVIPKEIWQNQISSSKLIHKKSWRKVAADLGMSFCGSTLFKSGVSRERLNQINNALPSEELKNLANSDIYWDEIISIEELGEEDVYDATVEEVHNFVANDIIVHNSIEQDADIVMFLLRREYYDPMDKPGMAELIVGKNRHGGVGTINLTYRKEIAQFANFTPLRKETSWDDSYKANDEAFSAFTP